MSDIYWLSILDNAHEVARPMVGIGGLLGTIALAVSIGMVGDDGCKHVVKPLRRLSFILLSVAIVGLVLYIFVPTKRDLIEAYIIIEGKEIVNAENADKAIQRVDQLVERVLDRVEVLDKGVEKALKE